MSARALVAVLAPGDAALPSGLHRWRLGEVDLAVAEPPDGPEALAALVVALGRHHAEVEPVVPLRWGAMAEDPAAARERLGPLAPWRARVDAVAGWVEWGLVLPPVPEPPPDPALGPGARFLARRRAHHAASLAGDRTRDAVLRRAGRWLEAAEPSLDDRGRVRLAVRVAPADLGAAQAALVDLEARWSGPWAPASFLPR